MSTLDGLRNSNFTFLWKKSMIFSVMTKIKLIERWVRSCLVGLRSLPGKTSWLYSSDKVECFIYMSRSKCVIGHVLRVLGGWPGHSLTHSLTDIVLIWMWCEMKGKTKTLSAGYWVNLSVIISSVNQNYTRTERLKTDCLSASCQLWATYE